MNTSEIIEAIATLSRADTDAVKSAVAKRRNVFYAEDQAKKTADRKARDDATMEVVRDWKPGRVVYFGKALERGWIGASFNFRKMKQQTITAGTKAVVYQVQPKAGRLWLTLPSGIYTRWKKQMECFSMGDVRDYEISPTELEYRPQTQE